MSLCSCGYEFGSQPCLNFHKRKKEQMPGVEREPSLADIVKAEEAAYQKGKGKHREW